MLHVLFGQTDAARWVLSEDEFLARVAVLEAVNFAGAPLGRVTVEAVDELDRVEWRAYFPSVSGLVILARQIREGRAAVKHGHG